MRLVRCTTGRETSAIGEFGDDVVPIYRCADGDTAVAFASWCQHVRRDVGVWLRVSPDYPPQIAARDVRTLSVLSDLRHVVIEAPDRVGEYAEVVRVLLGGHEVTFSNSVATLTHAFSRPAPTSPLTVWSYENRRLTSEQGTLLEGESHHAPPAQFTYFEG
jgi:hypothetical protein